MAEKRRTVRYELPADDVRAHRGPVSGAVPASGPNSSFEIVAGEPEDPGSHVHHDLPIYELMDSSMKVGGKSRNVSALPLGTVCGWLTSISRADDGRVNINFESKLARTLGIMYRRTPEDYETHTTEKSEPGDRPPGYEEVEGRDAHHPKLNVLIQVVGSRGDIQPFIALGNEIQRLGFRVRLATHDIYETLVREAGLEYYPVGGDPAALMAYMVKNPGLIPSFQGLQAGEIQKKREMIEELLEGFWYSCFCPDTATEAPFVADAIIANPPAFAHVHCAQVLGIPVHIMFTMPWTSTSAFPHPLANLNNSSGNQSMANYASYGILEYLTWQGYELLHDTKSAEPS